MTEEEIRTLKQLNYELFKQGYAQVKSLAEWNERVRTGTVRKPCPRREQNQGELEVVKKYDINGTPYHEPPYTDDENLEGARRYNGGVVAFSRPQRRPPNAQDDQP
jgi:hypothetical protein